MPVISFERRRCPVAPSWRRGHPPALNLRLFRQTAPAPSAWWPGAIQRQRPGAQASPDPVRADPGHAWLWKIQLIRRTREGRHRATGQGYSGVSPVVGTRSARVPQLTEAWWRSGQRWRGHGGSRETRPWICCLRRPLYVAHPSAHSFPAPGGSRNASRFFTPAARYGYGNTGGCLSGGVHGTVQRPLRHIQPQALEAP